MEKILSLIILFSSLFGSCKKNDSTSADIDYNAFQLCEEAQQWDSATIASQLIGSWKLSAMTCFWSGSKDIDTMDVQVNFDSSGNFSVLEHSMIHSQGTWSVNFDDSTNHLELNPNEQLVEGTILLCPDQVLFYESNLDLCDKVYNRIK